MDKHSREQLKKIVTDFLDTTDIRFFQAHWIGDTHHMNYHIKNTPGVVSYHRGMSKAVLEIETLADYVIKIPFCADDVYVTYNENDDFVFDSLELDKDGDFGGTFYCGAYPGCDEWDYCETEELMWDEIDAEYPHLSRFFARTEYLMTYEQWPIYVQKKCKYIAAYTEESNMWDDMVKYSSNSYESVKNSVGGYAYYPESWYELIARVMDVIDEDTGAELLEYCDNHIDDLHGYNFGCDEDGILIIFDYTGFDN